MRDHERQMVRDTKERPVDNPSSNSMGEGDGKGNC